MNILASSGNSRACLEKENYEYLQELIENANKIKRIHKVIQSI